MNIRDWPRCDCCGRGIPAKQLECGGGASWKFVPSSAVSYEEDAHRCKPCTEANGPPTPNQSVRVEVCQGRY